MIRRPCYDFEILYNKWSPFIIAPLIFIYHTLLYLTPFDLTWLQYFCLPSIMTTIHMYNSRATFKLCIVHKCLVNYVCLNLVFCIFEHYYIVPEYKLLWFLFMCVVFLITLLITFYYYAKYNCRIIEAKSL